MKILLLFECAWFAVSYIGSHTVRTEMGRYPAADALDVPEEVYGIGIGAGDGGIYWFHSHTGENEE